MDKLDDDDDDGIIIYKIFKAWDLIWKFWTDSKNS